METVDFECLSGHLQEEIVSNFIYQNAGVVYELVLDYIKKHGYKV